MYPHQSTISDSYMRRYNICCWTKACSSTCVSSTAGGDHTHTADRIFCRLAAS